MKDSLNGLRKVDSAGMYNTMRDFPAQVEDASRLAHDFHFEPCGRPEDVIICGLGGSAIGGDLARDFRIDSIPIPGEVSRDYHLPAYAGKKSLVLISSDSGTTDGTVAAHRSATSNTQLITQSYQLKRSQQAKNCIAYRDHLPAGTTIARKRLRQSLPSDHQTPTEGESKRRTETGGGSIWRT